MESRFRGPGRRTALLGRATECALLDRLIEDIRRGESRSLVLRGEPGIGKTALVEYLVESAADLHVARAVGVESEMELAYASSHQLCAPLSTGGRTSPARQSTGGGTSPARQSTGCWTRIIASYLGRSVLGFRDNRRHSRRIARICRWSQSPGSHPGRRRGVLGNTGAEPRSVQICHRRQVQLVPLPAIRLDWWCSAH
jgi:AAA ATPase domain